MTKYPPFRVSPCGREHHYNYHERLTLQYNGATRIRTLSNKFFRTKHVTFDFQESDMKEHRHEYSYEDMPFWRMEEVTNSLIDWTLLEVSSEEKNKRCFVCFTEGEKDALTLVNLGFEASCPWKPGLLTELDAKHLAMLDARIVLFWDRDEPGERKRDKNVEMLRGRIESLRVVDLPEKYNDITDYVEAGHTKEDVQRLIDQAKFIEGVEREVVLREEGVEREVVLPGKEVEKKEKIEGTRIPFEKEENSSLIPFPVDALIPVFRDMVSEMADCSVQAPLENCAGTILSVSSFALGNRVDLVLNEMISHFLSFFFLVVGESGERKSTMVAEAMSPIVESDRNSFPQYQADKLIYQNHLRAFEAKTREIEKSIEPGAAMTVEEEELEKMRQNVEKLEPILPKKHTNKATIAGLRKKLAASKGWGYICSAEAKPMINYLLGRGDGTDGSTNLSPFLSWNWGEDQSQNLGGKTEEGSFISVPNPALSMLLCTQHTTAEKFLNHPDVREEGMLGRIWVIEGESKIGDQEWHSKRKKRAAKDAYDQAIRTAYETSIDRKVRIVLKEGSEAEQLVIAFHKKMQRLAKSEEKRSSYRGVYCKSASQLGKVAAWIEYYKEQTRNGGMKLFPNQIEQIPLSLDSVERALKVVEWFLKITIHRLKESEEDLAFSIARKCSTKIQEKKGLEGKEFTKREFYRAFNYFFPNLKENPLLVEEVLELLLEYRWIEIVSQKNTARKSSVYKTL